MLVKLDVRLDRSEQVHCGTPCSVRDPCGCLGAGLVRLCLPHTPQMIAKLLPMQRNPCLEKSAKPHESIQVQRGKVHPSFLPPSLPPSFTLSCPSYFSSLPFFRPSSPPCPSSFPSSPDSTTNCSVWRSETSRPIGLKILRLECAT